MAKQLVIGLDIGTSAIRLAVCEHARGSKFPRVLALVKRDSRGLRRGYIVNQEETIEAIRELIADAERATKLRLRRAVVGIGGVTLEARIAEGSVAVGRADSEITETDVGRAIDASEHALTDIINRRIIHRIPLAFKLDGKKVPGRPQGLKGGKLEAKTLFITCLNQHLTDLLQAMEKAGLDVDDVVASPLAASLAVLDRLQKVAGAALVNVGSQTTSVMVFEEGVPISLQVFPLGSTDITNDIALGLKVSLEEAEQLKVGIMSPAEGRRKLEEIIEARLSDMFELVEGHLKKIGRSGLLPAGVLIIGGGAHLPAIEELAKNYLKLPAKTPITNLEQNTKGQIKDTAWAVAYGLSLFGADLEAEESFGVKIIKRTRTRFWRWLKELLP